MLDERIADTDMTYLTPTKLTYCGDNAAMVGITAIYQYLQSDQSSLRQNSKLLILSF